MAENTKIEWVDHTFNPWIGCTRISAACDNCYAASMSHRRGWARFEAGAPRRRTTAAYWRQPILWNKKAAAAGRRAKVFGPSLADPFDAEVDDSWRADYLAVIEACPWLDFILLTKRPQVAAKYFAGRKVPDNLWPGITTEDQKMLDLRAPIICSIQAKVHVMSAEPLLGDLDAARYLGMGPNSLSWVIAGGESGPKARPSHPDWFRSLRDQCAAAEVPFFFKQWGEYLPVGQYLPEHGKVHGATAVRPSRMKLHYGGNRQQAPEHAFADRGVGFAALADDSLTFRVGKKAAGALLDGIEHRSSPQ